MSAWHTDPQLFLYAKGTGPDDVVLRRCKKPVSSSSSSLVVPMKSDDFDYVSNVKNHMELIGDQFDWDETDYKRLVKYIYERLLLVNRQGLVIAEIYKLDDANEVPIYIRSLDVLPLKPYIPNIRERMIPLRTVKYLEDVNGKAAMMEEKDSNVSTKLTARVDDLKHIIKTLETDVMELTASVATTTGNVADLLSKNQTLAAQNKTLDSNAKTLEGKVTKLTAGLATITGNVVDLQSKNKTLEAQNKTSDSNAKTLEGKVTKLTAGLATITITGNVVDLQSNNKALKIENKTLDSNAKTLEGKVTKLTADLATITGNIVDLQSKNKTLEAQNKTLDSNAKNLEGKVTKLTADLTTITGNVVDLQSKNTTLEVENKTLGSNAKTLEGQVTKLTADLVTQMTALTTLQQKVKNINPNGKEVWMHDITTSEWVGVEGLVVWGPYDDLTIGSLGTFTVDDSSTNIRARYWYKIKLYASSGEYRAVCIEDLTPNKERARFSQGKWWSFKSKGKTYAGASI